MGVLVVSAHQLSHVFYVNILALGYLFVRGHVHVMIVDLGTELNITLAKELPLRLATHFGPRQDLRVLIDIVEAFIIKRWVPQRLVSDEYIGSDHIGLSEVVVCQATSGHGREVLRLRLSRHVRFDIGAFRWFLITLVLG